MGIAPSRARQTSIKEPPPPKTWDELDGGVRDTLKDFNLFRQVFLCRDETPWARDAANTTVDFLLDKSEKTYVVENMPPGSGKTTIFSHDLVLWLICGGGSADPAFGRALRIMLGSNVKLVAEHYVKRLRNTLERQRPYYDKNKGREAELSVVDAFGRFKPDARRGEDSVWQASQFVVAQMTDLDVYEKEPTVQAASRESGFLGERCNLAVWDDLVNNKNSRTIEQAENLAEWFEEEAETRIEPGGVLLLVGQRLSSMDLYRNRLDTVFIDETGEECPIYKHIVYPAHNEATCDGDHRQWDAKEEGCLLDSHRLSWVDLLRAQSKGKYRTVYQQEDSNPEDALVLEAWIHGGTDQYGYQAPGCLDRDRLPWEWPQGDSITYATVDPAAGNYWAIEVKAYVPETGYRYLIWGERRKMRAGLENGFLDYNPDEMRHVGLMEDLQRKSGDLGNPIMVWVIEANAAHDYLFQNFSYRMWRQKWPKVEVITHKTGRNKNDPEFGVDATLGMVYKTGRNRIPYAKSVEMRNYLRVKFEELTKYPNFPTFDTVMTEWFGENRLLNIIQAARRMKKLGMGKADPTMPSYVKQRALPPALQR